MTDRDWREWAYTNIEHWPDAIPETGPRREHGPYSWGPKVHHDPHDLDDYPHRHPDAASVGESHLGDVCPYCGVPLDWLETVVLINGREVRFCDIDDVDDPTPAYHPECWTDRSTTIAQLENTALTDFAASEAFTATGGDRP